MKQFLTILALLIGLPSWLQAQFPAHNEQEKYLILPSFNYYYRTCFDLLHGQPKLVETETTTIKPAKEEAQVLNGKYTYAIDLLGRVNWEQYTNTQTSYTKRTILHYAGNTPVCIRREIRSRNLQWSEEFDYDSLSLEVRQYGMQGNLDNFDSLNNRQQILLSKSFENGMLVGEKTYHYSEEAVYPDSVLWHSQPPADRNSFTRNIYHQSGLLLKDERWEYQKDDILKEESIQYSYSDTFLLQKVRHQQNGLNTETSSFEIVFTYESFDDKGNWTERTIQAEGGVILQKRTITYW